MLSSSVCSNKIFCKKTFIFGLICFVAITTGLYFWERTRPSVHSLWEVLDYYGFKDPAQKQSLEFLMKKSGIIEYNQTFMTMFPKRKSSALLFKDLVNFIELTQKYFVVRIGIQERWETQPVEWMKVDLTGTEQALRTLKLLDAIAPTYTNPDLTAVFGATMGTMKSRLKYIDDLNSSNQYKINFLALLTGERKATIGIDGSQQELEQIATKHKLTIDQLTEATLMREAYSNTEISNKILEDNFIFINTLAKKEPLTERILRPTTETTVQDLCDWLLKEPGNSSVNTIVFVSNQPYVKYQEAIVKEVLKKNKLLPKIKFEVVGDKAVSVTTATAQRLIGALGTQIFAQTPEVIANTKISTKDRAIKDKLMELYKRQPLVYRNIKALLEDH